MKRIADNPHDERLGAEIAEGHGEIFSHTRSNYDLDSVS